MKARIHISLKQGVLDPQGQAIGNALKGLGFAGVAARGGAGGRIAVPHDARFRHGVERPDRVAGGALARAAADISLCRLAPPAIAVAQCRRGMRPRCCCSPR